MKETVKTINGYDITRYAGTSGAYFVSVREGCEFVEFHTFRTIKAAVQFCKTLPEKHC